MKRQIRKFYGHYYHRKGVVRENWDLVPPRLRRELLKFEHKVSQRHSTLHVRWDRSFTPDAPHPLAY